MLLHITTRTPRNFRPVRQRNARMEFKAPGQMRTHRLRPGLRSVQHHPLRQTAAGPDVHRPAQPVRGLQDHLRHGENPVHEGKYRRGGRGAGNGGNFKQFKGSYKLADRIYRGTEK